MSAVFIPATDGGQPFGIARNGAKLVLSRRSRTGKMHQITANRADAIALCNNIIDNVEQDN